jgi:hypothetical protein
MPDQGLTPPYLDPSQYPAYLEMQRKQMLAQQLMQSAQSANQTPGDWDSMKVVPRRGMLSNISGALGSYLAGKAMKGSQAAQSKYFQGLYGGGEPTAQTPGQALPSSPGAFDTSSGPGLLPPVQPQNPLLPPGVSRGTAQQALGMAGPEEYAKGVVLPNLMGTPEWQNALRVSNGDPEKARSILRMANAKARSIDIRPAGTAGHYDDTGKFVPDFTAPTANGVQTQWGPNGPSQSVVPGAVPAITATTGAETAAKVANTPQTFPTAGGGSTVGYPGDVLGAPPAQRPQPGAPPGPPGSPPQAPPSGMQPKAGGYFPQAPKPPTGPLWDSMPKLPISNAIGAPNDFVKGRLQEAGKKDGELSTQYGKEADLADQKMQYNAESVKALAGAETGPSSEWLTEHRANLMEWGVPASLIPGSGKVTNTMELNKNLKQSALQGARAIFGNRMTQMEVKLQHEELSPSTSMTKDAIASLMQQDNIKQQYAKQRAQDYGTFVQHGGDPLRFESWYSTKRPLTRFAAQATTPQAAVQRLQQKPDLLKDFQAKYGWNPNE